MSKMPINRRLKAAIVLSGKTMSEVADAIGIPKSNLSCKINGRIRFNEYEMLKIADFLCVSVTEIFFAPDVNKTITKAI